MEVNDFPKPTDDGGNYEGPFPNPFIDPRDKGKEYDLNCCKSIYYNNFRQYNNPFGNWYRNTWVDNRLWARGTQSNIPFGVRPGAKNDVNKNPLLNHIDFSPVNEIVKFCDEYVSTLEQFDFGITATAINPAAAVAKSDKINAAEAYRQLKPVLDALNQQSGANIAPKNPAPYDFESQKEVEMFYQLGDKSTEEMQCEIAHETIMNDSDWYGTLGKMVREDFRDCGLAILKHETDTSNKIRASYIDPCNSGWEEFRGHYNHRMTKFWTLTVKTGAQVVAESGGQLTKEQWATLARMSAGKFGNPMLPNNIQMQGPYGYTNIDNPNGLTYYFESWKFGVVEAWWEDWEITKYRGIYNYETNQRESFGPVDYNYKDKNNGKPYDDNGVKKVIKVRDVKKHYYRQCKWVVGTDIIWQNGPVPNCPRDPRDPRFALSPIKLYRTSNAPYSQRIKVLGKIAQLAWYQFQNEIAKAKPHNVSINVKALDNITSLDGRKITRRHLLELYAADGLVLYSDTGAIDSQGNIIRSEPIKPVQNVDIAAFQRWIDTINFCSVRMQQEGGIYDFQGSQFKDQSVFANKQVAKASNLAMAQAVDGMSKLVEELAIDTVGKLQILIQKGEYHGYISAIGSPLLRPMPISKDISIYTFGIKVEARPSLEARQQLKADIHKSFEGMGDPTSGSPWLPDLIYLDSLIDSGTNLKVIALIAGYLHNKNLNKMQQMAQQNVMAQTQSQQALIQQKTQLDLQKEQALSQIRMQEDDHKTANAMKLLQAQSQFKTENQITTGNVKTMNKMAETEHKHALEAPQNV